MAILKHVMHLIGVQMLSPPHMQIPQFKELLISTALDGIERQFSVIVDRGSVKRLKMRFKGVATPTIIRTKTNEVVPPQVLIEGRLLLLCLSSFSFLCFVS